MSATRNPILFEDSWLMVVNKPAGVFSHPNVKTPSIPPRRDCAFEGRYDFEERRFDTPDGPIWLVHRLDQDTSGALLAAKTADVARKCRVCFEERQVQKTYVALVMGKLSPSSGVWRDHLEKQKGRESVRSTVVRGRPFNAELQYNKVQFTHYLPSAPHPASSFKYPESRIQNPESLSLLEITLLTGRTHQIRVQAAARGHPVAGDRIYGDFRLNRQLRQQVGLRRLFLHAARLAFRHPATNQLLELEAPLPGELEDCLATFFSPRSKSHAK